MTSLLPDVRVGLQRPRIHLAPPAVDSDGPDAVWLASRCGFQPDEWQEFILGDALGLTAEGRWSAPRVGWSIPRQNGKNGALEVFELYKMVVCGRRVLHTAHQVKTAMKAFKRLKWFFGDKADDPNARYPDLNALVTELRNTNGQEAIYLSNGGSFELIARSKASGRGWSVDDLVCDEAQDMTDEDYAALLSTISASPDPQTILTGTPPTPGSSKGEVFAKMREDALAGNPTLAWAEWSAPDLADLDALDSLLVSNPAVGIRLSVDFSAVERASLSDETYARERLGMWSTVTHSRVIDGRVWADLADQLSQPGEQVAFGIEVSPDDSSASIGMAGWREDGRRHLEVVENHRTGDELRHPLLGDLTVLSPDWVVPVAQAITKAQRGAVFVIEAASRASALAAPLRKAGVEVTLITTRDAAAAAGRIKNEAQESLLVHLDQPSLNFALSVARKKAYGTEGLWTWHRRSADSDITPLGSVTLAVHGLSAAKVRTNRAAFF